MSVGGIGCKDGVGMVTARVRDMCWKGILAMSWACSAMLASFFFGCVNFEHVSVY